MGQVQTTGGVTTVGPGATLVLTTPICAQLSISASGASAINVNLEGSLDGVNFFSLVNVNTPGTIRNTTTQSFMPLVSIRYNVQSITGTASISIAAASSGSQ
jgi:hypothetical protein